MKSKSKEAVSRFSVMQTAYRCGVVGYVKRNSDKSVLIESEGSDEQVSEFLEICGSRIMWIPTEIIEVSETEVKNYTSFDLI